jgi:glycosyltransferase involved in cell wall biosynthesis
MPNLYRFVRYVMARIAARRAVRLTAVSPYLASELRRITRAPIAVIPNPLPRVVEQLAATSLDRPDRKSGARIVAILNGWNRMKNGAAALRALIEVRKVEPSATLTLFGDACGEGDAAYRFARENGLANGVIFRGRVDHSLLMRDLPNFDLLLHPALEESFGAGIAEAMALGLPVVAGAHSGAVPWVVGSAGVLVDVRDPTAISAAVLRLLGNSALRRQLGEMGRRSTLERFSRAAVAAATEAIYFELMPLPTAQLVHA